MKKVKLSDGNEYPVYGNGKKMFIASVFESYSKEVAVMADNYEDVNEILAGAYIIMEPGDYISDSFLVDTVSKCNWEIVEDVPEAKKPFVRLTISNRREDKRFREATGLSPTHEYGGFSDYDDLDLHNDMATVIRTLGQMDSSSYYFTTEEEQ